MAFEFSIETFLNAVKDGEKNKALGVKADTIKEIERLENIVSISKTGKKALKGLREIIRNVENGDIEKAQALRQKTLKQFKEHLGFYLKEIKDVEQLQDYDSKGKQSHDSNEFMRQNRGDIKQKPEMNSSDDRNDQRNQPSKQLSNSQVDTGNKTQVVQRQPHTSTEDRQPYYSSITHERRNSAQTHIDDNASKIQRSKRASQAMRQNNPDIADLSDTNRPTKIAERFSELYDNEWTEAFEELGKKGFPEEKAIEYLWALVEEAYKLCSKTSEGQIKKIAKVFERILVLGPHNFADETLDVPNREYQEDKQLLIQYRKDIASEAIPRIEKEFLEMIKNKRKGKLPFTMPAVDQFSTKVVEVTWWMCVQDPPVYMCLRKEEEFDQSLYKAYTKSGKKPAFFVWPALRLYEKGGVLIKGVVQYI